ncbi:glycoside hydrolase family 3 N-terminal domain-containing protein [Deinococcus cellulosilyticus]|uniref:Glycosyl hydrolase n=1 Tax=Deinococcus cellulosilyticus (strain DSM 18568 / NBRC 106333 / KACC 11606 / 5516J-15) TaxID=1223518 RepID=A0A511NAR7_DEIC1|nr:glycoside hydrolase family 3 N-terminal domain-containing protein [Deinococcus cellulosilyticus]GEM49925.1 glycosyl hydrolase [Deinococcus cellulosilyticus NBRC 106333 = KACC 11606]
MSDTPLYLNPDLDLNKRLQDLLGRMTIREKISQLWHDAPGIPRLGIAAYNSWSEGLHGVARNGRATVFPQAIGMAATWNPDLIQRVADVISTEARAKYHAALKRNGKTDIYQGLNLWSPNINIFRDPRWGRGQETWGEDPYLTGTLGSAFVRGLQGDDPTHLKTAACAKHYAVHSGPEKLRHGFDAQASLKDLHETYLPAFKALVQDAKVEAVMGAYNRVNGDPACAHPYLLGKVLRESWGFQGHVVSDCWAISDFDGPHSYTPNPTESAARALKEGCDLECGCRYTHLLEAHEQGLITEEDLDRALTRVYTTRFKLGMFDPPERVPYASISPDVVGSKEHADLAYEAAVESVVLLRNKNNLLPIREDIRSMFILGPTATSVEVLLGNYYGMNGKLTTLLEGLIGRIPEGVRTEYRTATHVLHETEAHTSWIFKEAAKTDVVIACMGITPHMEGEEGESIDSAENGDRTRIELPEVQLNALRQLSQAGARTVLVLTGGSAVALEEVAELVDAIVFVWYSGQEGGRAVADVLFGDRAPAGKLPVTFPKRTEDLPDFQNYGMAGRTYRYSEVEPLFPFGHGLTYGQVELSDLQVPEGLQEDQSLQISLQVSNPGPHDITEVVQVYVRHTEAPFLVPLQQLVGFQKVTVPAGSSSTLGFEIAAEQLKAINEDGEAIWLQGPLELTVGTCSPGQRGLDLGATSPLTARIAR